MALALSSSISLPPISNPPPTSLPPTPHLSHKLEVGEEADALQGLPEAHLVGQDGVDAVIKAAHQPLQAQQLVLSHRARDLQQCVCVCVCVCVWNEKGRGGREPSLPALPHLLGLFLRWLWGQHILDQL